jgi:putative inorganic carbon (HCO3(-)) transporter
MTSIWTQITTDWRSSSYLYRLIGLLNPWYSASWLLQWDLAIGALLISLTLGFAPFVSTSLIGVLLIATGGFWALLTITDNKSPSLTPIHFLVLIYWCIALIATAFSPVKTAALSGLIQLTLYLLFFALAARIFQSKTALNWTMTTLLLISLVISVHGIRQKLFGAPPLATWNDPTSPLAQTTRAYSYLGNPNLLAGYLIPLIALSLGAIFVWRGWLKKALGLTMLIINSICLYFTDSRGGWIGLLALFLVFLLLLRFWWGEYLPKFWRIWLLPILFGLLGVLLMGAFLTVEPLRLRIQSIFQGRSDSSNNFRINVWEAVFEMIADRPLIGIGPGHDTFNKIYPLYMRPRFTALSAYSIFLQVLVETGIIGFSCFLSLLSVTFYRGMKQLKRFRDQKNLHGFWVMAAIAGCAGILAHGFVDTVWYRPQINTLWWLLVAIVASQLTLEETS